MQDNFKNIDKKFTDRAWREMRSLLEKEMPAEPKGRLGWKRYALLLLLLGLGIGLGFGLKTMIPFSKRNQVIVKTSSPLAGKAKEEKGQESGLNTSELSLPETPQITKEGAFKKEGLSKGEFLKKEEAVLKGNSISKSWKKKETNAEKVAEVGSGFLKNELSRRASGHSFREKNNVQKNEIQPQKTLSQELNPPLEKAAGSQSSEVDPEQTLEHVNLKINSLELLPLEVLELAKRKPIALNIPIKTKKSFATKLHPDALAATIGGLLHPTRDLSGFSAGLLLDYHLKNPKWTFQTGLQYAFLHRNILDGKGAPGQAVFDALESSGFDLDNPVVDTLGTMSTGNPSLSVGDLENLPSTIHLHYLQLPFSMAYRPNAKIRLQGGLTFSLLMLASKSTSGGVFNRSTAIVQESFSPTSNASSTNFRSFIEQGVYPIRKIDVSSNLGIGYFPVPEFGINFRYNLGLVNYLKLPGLSAYNRSFQLSLIYFFGS